MVTTPALLLLLLLLLQCAPTTSVRILPSEEHRKAADTILAALKFPFPSGANGNNSTSHPRHLAGPTVDVPFPTSPDEHLVTSLPLLDPQSFTTNHWAGLLPASDQGDKYLFYWLFAPDLQGAKTAQVEEANIPLLIWLNGGPGCSSMDGLFLENGPWRFDGVEQGQVKLIPAEFSWHKAPAYTLYIDQPVGTGLSFTTSRKYPKNDEEVNIDFYHFLQSFLTVHADKFVTGQSLNRPLYFSGESHAGHYIPSMMAYIVKQNDALASAATADATKWVIPLAGAAIGNGWVDPYVQYAAAKAAYGHGIIDLAQMAALDEKEKQCQGLLDQKRYSSGVCFQLLDAIVGQSYGSKSPYKVSQYDIRKVESHKGKRTFPPGHKTVEVYLGDQNRGLRLPDGTTQAVLEAIHATYSQLAGQQYQECTDPPYNALSHQDGLGVVPDVVTVLQHAPSSSGGEKPIRLLFFNGVTDLICNHVGNEVMLERLPWTHQTEWTKSERIAWKAASHQGDNKISGYMKEFENLLFLKILESGHMVPMDLPDVALDMMVAFMFGGPDAFRYSPQTLERAEDTAATGGKSNAAAPAACPSCPVCPVVTDINGTSVTGRAGGAAATRFAGFGTYDNRLWIGAALVLAFLVAVFVVRRRRTAYRRTPVSSYDLEMRGGTYFDEPQAQNAGTAANNTTNTSSSSRSFRAGAGDESRP